MSTSRYCVGNIQLRVQRYNKLLIYQTSSVKLLATCPSIKPHSLRGKGYIYQRLPSQLPTAG